MAFSSVSSSWEAASFLWAHQGEEGTDRGAPVPAKSHPPLPAAAARVIAELKLSPLMRAEGLGP